VVPRGGDVFRTRKKLLKRLHLWLGRVESSGQLGQQRRQNAAEGESPSPTLLLGGPGGLLVIAFAFEMPL
jgi:hypothetical protein